MAAGKQQGMHSTPKKNRVRLGTLSAHGIHNTKKYRFRLNTNCKLN